MRSAHRDDRSGATCDSRIAGRILDAKREVLVIRDTIGDWQELSALYERADALGEAELLGWLEELRGERHRLLGQLEKMLAARRHVATGDFLQSLPRLRAEPRVGDADWAEGSRIGAYRLIRHIGSGGMAEVWLAARADGAFERQVAIKLLFNHPTRSQRETFVERFRRERDILASLHHPHIAGLHDAGVTPSGQPWLALEYVQGEPITDWCDNKRLTIEGRVKVFGQVLLAVEHAHANLIIHRDLKPSNILVTEQGEVKLLDFGIAKLVEANGLAGEATDLTRQGGRPLTLRYASPEQILGRPLTTSCDVYALGVVLYELLCGSQPYESALGTAAQLEQAILDREPRPPSGRDLTSAAALRQASPRSLRHALHPDLDAIVLRCLGKQTTSRYSSVEALGSDLHRWAVHKPVMAAKPGFLYRARKFLLRHRMRVVATAAVALVAMVGSFWGLTMRSQAGAEAARAAAARTFVLELFSAANPDVGHNNVLTANDMLEAGRRKAAERLASQPALHVDVLRQIGEIQGTIGSYSSAADTLASAIQILERIDAPRQLAATRISLADISYRMDDLPRATRLLDETEAGLARAGHRLDEEARGNLEMIRGWIAISDFRGSRAVEAFKAATDRFAGAFGDDDHRTIDALRGLARAETMTKDFESAIAHMAEADQRGRRSKNLEPADAIRIAIESAQIRIRAGRYAEGMPQLEAAARRCEEYMDADSETCSVARLFQARYLTQIGEHDAALRLLPVVLKITRLQASPRRRAEALSAACYVLAANRKLAPDDPMRAELQQIGAGRSQHVYSDAVRAGANATLIEAMLFEGDAAGAARQASEDLARMEASGRSDIHARVGSLHLLRGIAWQQQSRHEAALSEFDAALSRFETFYGSEHPLTVLYGLNRVRSQLALGRPADAAAVAERAHRVLEPTLGKGASVLPRVRSVLSAAGQTTSVSGGTAHLAEFFI